MSTMPVGGLMPRATDDAADLVVRNAETHTGDPRLPQAGAIAVRRGLVPTGPAMSALAVLLVGTSPAAGRLPPAGPAWTGPRS
ncbi:hypothetical protein [Streptomyces sp. ISL-12]|uniref:hypothetical protein n=1 Tax=Streptomyces sp. ISL-12 TaxID=2819177 RepID=UPI0020364BDC|nr:hypothetical protein [Streptomyces sp. ISL-12]